MGKKFRDQKTSAQYFPGPGQYDPIDEVVARQGPKVSGTQGQRSDPVNSKFLNCGPGSYNINYVHTSKGKQFSIGKAKRF